MKMTVQAKDSMIDNLVNKIYNLLFGYLDSLFDDSMYEKEEKTIPKDQVKKPENMVDTEGREIDPDGCEVAGDAKEIIYTPLLEGEATDVSDEPAEEEDQADSQPGESAGQQPNLDPFTVNIVSLEKAGYGEFVGIQVINNATNKKSERVAVPASDKQAIQKTIEKCKKEVSATCKIKLTKITGSSGTSVRLTNIHSNYDLPIAVQDISCILDDDSFVDSLPEGDSAYLIDSGEDGYDVNALDWDDSRSLYTKALDACFKALGRIYELGWYSQGTDSANFKNIVETLTYSIQYNINELAKLCIIHGVPTSFEVKDSDATSVADKWVSLCECVSGYIASLECLSLSATGDEKNMIYGWVRNLKDIECYQIPCLHPETI